MDIIGLQAGPTEGGLQVVSWPQPRSNKGGRPFSAPSPRTRTELSNRRDLLTDKKLNFKFEFIHHNSIVISPWRRSAQTDSGPSPGAPDPYDRRWPMKSKHTHLHSKHIKRTYILNKHIIKYLARICLTEWVISPVVVVQQVAQPLHRGQGAFPLPKYSRPRSVRPAVVCVVDEGALQTTRHGGARMDRNGLKVGNVVGGPVAVGHQLGGQVLRHHLQ